MKKSDILFFRSWFSDYSGGFYSGNHDPVIDKNIRLKEEHTLRVCENIVLIGQSLNLDRNKLYLALAAALFHDVGRFTQFKTYKTFDDTRSENHALIGIKVLEETGVLSRLPETEQSLIIKAVKYHNLPRLPDNESGDCLLFSGLVRDADKLDIWNVFIKYNEERDVSPNPSLYLALPDVPEYSESFIDDILNNRVSENRDFKTFNDMKLFQLSWVFDINFPFTFLCIEKRNYLEKLISSLPATEDIKRVHVHLKNYVHGKVQESMNPEMNKFIVKGVKKMFGLTRTKIRLAKESDTECTKPAPLPLVKMLSGRELKTVSEAEKYLDELKLNINYDNPKSIAKAVIELMDVIEGVKYKYEPAEFLTNLREDTMKDIGRIAQERSKQVNILLMTKDAPCCGLNLFVGENPPDNALFLSGVPTTLSFFLNFAFNSKYFSDNMHLKNVNVFLGRRTLITNALWFAFGEFGAVLSVSEPAPVSGGVNISN